MIDILMPRLSDTMTEGAITAWHKQPGDPVHAGDLLVEIETDKALMEQEAYDDGILSEILVAAGENVPIGTPIARLDDGSEAAAPSSGTAPVQAGAAPASPVPASTGSATPVAAEHQAATPLVRRLARERGIDLAEVAGTGPGGRVVRADLEAAIGRRTADTPAEPIVPAETPIAVETHVPPSDARASRAVPFDAIRQQIASRLSTSAAEIPSFTATASASVDELLALRARINEQRPGDAGRISVNDLLVRAVAVALRRHPGVNASYAPGGRGATLLHDRVHIGIAVASPAGLVVPVLRDADRLAVSDISTRTRDLVDRASERTLGTVDMSDGTFTISNLGMFGVDHFTAIINPPQGAILAVGAIRDEVALVDGEARPSKRLSITLTADHRIIDGALAARFLASLTELLEQPLAVLV
ncbi:MULTISPECIES: dihydrolipoamide acetyltransferase family protein [unclassified Leucobacter]|uniref:dihydrolipoamide acetyltransferase family protein n=1 Tax=unclassified Leucobacter TaxID=2621730 RepID=UPI000621A881|nr:dihydrolipoamide acetyltransferase family protein [Leucobacter sp. Ag1]KKI21446.1 dihydrolipoamide acetyltransferase [Leucobacter sp. Ag1]